MKLKQLTESFEQQTGEFPDTTKHQSDVAGKGAFGYVRGDEDPFMINKHAIRKDQSYDTYVKFIVDNKLAQSNPHFPRIYQISDGKWKMEKLPFTLVQFLESGDYDENDHNREMIANIYFTSGEFTSYWDFSEPDKIKLGSYKKALEIIHEFREEFNKQNYHTNSSAHYISDDLHSKNIMVRLTPQGPQLVITDPWA